MNVHAHSSESSSGTWTGRDIAVALAITGGIIATGVILAPHIGIDTTLAGEVMAPLHESTSLAGGINELLNGVPLIGGELAKGGMFTAMTAAIAGIGGVLTGNYLSKKYEEGGRRGTDWGKIVKWAGMATSALISLPSILTGLSHGIAFLAAKIGGYEAGMTAIEVVGNSIGYIPTASTTVGFAGASSLVPHLLSCGAAAGSLALGLGVDHAVQHHEEHVAAAPEAAHVEQAVEVKPAKKKLRPDDRNNFVTQQEQAIVDEYNAAPMPRRLAMQKELREKGYDPDFTHADGTMHLYKHTHSREAVPDAGRSPG